MRFTTICSGSSGNCTYVNGGKTHVLIDAGCSLQALRLALAQLEVEETALDAILITHEHTDHIRGAARIARKLDIPIYASERTWENLPFRDDFLSWERHTFAYGMEIGDLGMDFFRLSHDAVQPVGFVLHYRDEKIGVATDTGIVTPSMEKLLRNADGLVLEANHCPKMLRQGPYPQYLKQRILSEQGHLSNEQAGAALCGMIGARTRAVLLAHLSEKNNDPQRAKDQVLDQVQTCPLREQVRLLVAPRRAPHPMIELQQQDEEVGLCIEQAK